MTLGIVPGPLITAYHFSAGFAAFAALVCVGVALSGIRIRGIWWLAAMCVASVGSLMSHAAFHMAPDVSTATDLQRWQNVWSAGQMYSLLGFLAIYTRQRSWRALLIVSGVVFALMVIMAIQMPPGARFAGEYTSVMLEFPWGERLQMLRGELSNSSLFGRFGFFMLFFWGLYRAAIPYAKYDRTGSLVISLGLVILILAAAFGGLVETGTLNFVYFGNYGYIFLVLLALYLVVRELLASNARLQRTTAALRNELDSHRETRKEVQHLSFNDPLTDLPSRAGLFKLIDKPIRQARQQRSQFAMLHIDLDRFDVINDTLGPNVGDRLLQGVSRRLQTLILSDEDFAARTGADEFIIILNEQPAAASAVSFADAVHDILRQPFHLDEHVLHVTASVGIALYPDDANQADALLVAADLATREAKRQGRNCTRFFRRELDEAIRERLHVGNALRTALTEQQFELYFQPQIDARSGQVTSLEALIRWHHPEGGLTEPGRFIPIAEEMHLISEVGAWVIDESCRILADWREAGIHDIRVAVNLSAQQLHQAELIDTVRNALDRHGLTGKDLELEITESMVMEDPDLCIEQLRQLSALGIKLAMDDFGTGYSSLSYLRRLPIDTLKIDRSFVHDIEMNDNDAAICATTISMANTLGLDTVAEGIETEAQASRLRELKCDRFQGYLYARPMPQTAVHDFLRNHGVGV